MKRIVGIALGMAISATTADAGNSIGGFNGGMYFDAVNRTIHNIPGKLSERFAVMRQGTDSESNLVVYSMAPKDFSRLQNVADTPTYIKANGEDGTTRAYQVCSGDEAFELVFVDRVERRAAVRAGVTK